jgi:hypothetical protein
LKFCGTRRTSYKGKDFAGGKEGCSCFEAAEQPIETDSKAGQRSKAKQVSVEKDI